MRCYMSNDEIIRQLAYEMWESDGRPDGQSDKHWESASILAAGQTHGEKSDNKENPLDAYELQEPEEPHQPDQT